MQIKLILKIAKYYDLLQTFADILKFLFKKYVSSIQVNLILFFLGPLIILIPILLFYTFIPSTFSLASLGLLYLRFLFYLIYG